MAKLRKMTDFARNILFPRIPGISWDIWVPILTFLKLFSEITGQEKLWEGQQVGRILRIRYRARDIKYLSVRCFRTKECLGYTKPVVGAVLLLSPSSSLYKSHP